MNVRGKGIIVTGASRGLGEALAREFARRGGRVIGVGRDEATLKSSMRRIREEGGDAHAVVADIADKNAVHGIAAAAAELVGPVEILVHNASTLGPVPLRLLLDTPCEIFEEALAVNLVGPFRLSKIVAGAMAVRGSGLVVHVTSDAAVSPYPKWGAYGISKAALDHMTRIWATELAPFNVEFLSVDPGEMNTKMHADAMPEADPGALSDPKAIAARLADLIERSPRLASGSRVDVEGRPL